MITLNRRERMSLAVTAAVLLTLPALHPLYQDGGWVPECVGAALTVGVVSFLGRVIGFPVVLQPVLGVLALMTYSALVFAGSTMSVVVPTADTFTLMNDLIQGGSDNIQTLAAPVPTADSLVLLGVLAVGGIAVLLDTIAVVAGRAALAGLPLLLLFAAPSAISDTSAGWWAFALAGAGWLLVLLADGTERVHRWGVALAAPGRRAKPGGGLGYAGTRIGVAAVGFAIALPLVLPDVGDGQGSNGDDGPRTITTYNPLTKLRGELTLPREKQVLTYTSDDDSPDYLRMTTLEAYDGNGWKQGTLNGRLDRDSVEDRTLPTPEGVDPNATVSPVEVTIDIDTLNAYWLPAPATPTEVEVEGPWLWDARSQSVFATRTDTSEIGPYTVRSQQVTPDAATLKKAGSAIPDDIRDPFLEAPKATAKVRQITQQVVAGKQSAFDRALALQDYFRGDEFEYSLRTTTGSSPDALENFLDTKRGFCEQYASAMAAMLRLAGVPARVAVGFTPGTKRADGSRLVTTKDAHAWPEAWIPGAGWLRFEPTPSQGFAPVYTRDQAAPAPTTSAGPTATASASAAPGGQATERPNQAERGLAPGTVTDDGGPTFPTGLVLSLVGVLLLLSVPAVTHVARRRARWQRPSAGTAWAQLRDDAFDVGLPLDPSRSPRQVLRGLAAQAALEGPAKESLARVALAVERDRYAPAGDQELEADLAHDVTTVRHGLHAPLPRLQRLRLLLLPPSTLRWARDGVRTRSRATTDGVAQLGAGLSARLRRS